MSSECIHTPSGTPEERFTVTGGWGSSSRRVMGPRPPNAEVVPRHSPPSLTPSGVSVPSSPTSTYFHLIATQILLKRMYIKNGSYIVTTKFHLSTNGK